MHVFKERKKTRANRLCWGAVLSRHFPELDFSLAAPLVLTLAWQERHLIWGHPLMDQRVDFIGKPKDPQQKLLWLPQQLGKRVLYFLFY